MDKFISSCGEWLEERTQVVFSRNGPVMEMQEIEVIIDKDGKVRLEVRGVKGMSCLDLTKALEEALGGQVEDRQMTPEASEAAQPVQGQQWLKGG
jgi:hypothetical protein